MLFRSVKYILDKYAGHPQCPTMYQVNRILKCPTYTGVLYGVEDYCPAYITPDQFRKIKSVSDAKIIPHQVEPFLFSSMIKCPVCGKNMSGLVKRQHLKSGGISEYKRYRCCAKFTEFHGGACISESVVEEYLITHVEEQINNQLLELDRKQKQLLTKPDKSAGIRAELDRLNNMYQKGRIKEEYYDEQYALLSAKLENCSPLAEINASLEACRALSSAFSDGWQEMYQTLDIAHKKSFWKEIIREINVDPQTRKISGFQFFL